MSQVWILIYGDGIAEKSIGDTCNLVTISDFLKENNRITVSRELSKTELGERRA